jgi:NADPH-dependent 2,4-dienoyl-CoA reductase/sulfur reductase-like enzyme
MRNVVIIGAGPAGLAAARAASTAGASVTLLDSSEALGGQFWRHLPDSRPSRNEKLLHHGWAKFGELSSALQHDESVRIVRGAHVWAIDTLDGVTVHAVIGEPDGAARTHESVAPDALILATGAHDRTLPFPGWDLPGVFTGGAAQALAKGERLAVGERVLVAGAGPFLLPVAQSLVRVGAKVVGVLEANGLSHLARGWSSKPWKLVGAASKGGELAGYAAGQLRHRIPYRMGHAVIAAHGTGRVESVTTARLDADWKPIPGTEKTVHVDAVCVSHGFTPRLELAVAAGCELTEERFVQVDERQSTSTEGVFAAGEITGIGGVDLALAEGELAGHYAATGADAGRGVGAAHGAPRSALRRRSVFTGFAQRIEAAHGIRPGWSGWLEDSTVICRCEEVTLGEIRRTGKRTESESLRSLKLSTRAGLGICQGRVCGRTVESLMGAFAPGGALNDDASLDRRPIATPLRIGELASRTRHNTNGKVNHD